MCAWDDLYCILIFLLNVYIYKYRLISDFTNILPVIDNLNCYNFVRKNDIAIYLAILNLEIFTFTDLNSFFW